MILVDAALLMLLGRLFLLDTPTSYSGMLEQSRCIPVSPVPADDHHGDAMICRWKADLSQ
jgi:hypothetical protein